MTFNLLGLIIVGEVDIMMDIRVDMNEVENLKSKYKVMIKNYETSIALLKSIEVIYKKDGTEYANMLNAFKLKDNSRFKNFKVCRDDENYIITATDTTTDTYVKETIYGYENLVYDYSTGAGKYIIPEGVTEDRVISGGWRVPYYMLNTKEMNDRISNMISNYYSFKEENEKKAQRIDAMCDILKETANKLNDLGELPYGWKECIR